MAKQPVMIRAAFFLDTDVFQHLSQWEKSLMDFYSAHGVEIERIRVMGAGEGELFYTVSDMDVFDKPVERKEIKPIETKLLEERKIEVKRPISKKLDVSIGGIKPEERVKLTFSKGHMLPRTVGEVPTIRYKPLKKKT